MKLTYQNENNSRSWEFFAMHGAEVEARGSEELSTDQKASLTQLASGEARTKQRA